jgi:two-component system, sensor histidine kinase and response regulator
MSWHVQRRIDRLTPRTETVAVVAFCALAALAVTFDGFGHLVAFAQRHETYQLDAVFSVLLVLGVILTAVSMRRTTELRRELALRASAVATLQSEPRYSSLVSTMQQVVFDIDQRGAFTFLNPAWTRIMGYAVDEALGRRHADFVHPADRARHRRVLQRAAEGSGSAVYEIRCIAKDGSEKWLEAHVQVATDADRTITGCTGTLTDVTRRHQAAESLCASEARYAEQSARLNATLENMSQGIMMVASDNSVPVMNRRAMELLELPDDMLASKLHCRAILQFQWDRGDFAHAPNELQRRIRTYLHDGDLQTLPPVYQHQRPSGTILETRTVLLDGGGVVRTFTDVTEREAGNRAKAAFLATMSHEIRTPLHGVVGTASLLLDTTLSTEQRHHVETIQECSDTLLELISEILDFSKLEAGRLDLESSEFDLVETTETVLDIVEARARAKDLLVVFAPSPDLPQRVVSDPGRLRQVLLNLIGNAIKFTDSGSVVLRAYPRRDGDQAVVRFEVQDTGIGIPEHARDRLFQEFSQVEASVTRRYGGSGLGLAISQRIATALGGRIGFDSRPGEGSTFWLELPLPAAQGAAIHAPRRTSFGAGRRVVLAAPGGPGREALAALLVSQGFTVVKPDGAGRDRADLALLHHSVLPKARFSRRARATPWIVFGFGAGRHAGAVEGVIDGAVKPSHLAATLAEVSDGVIASDHPARQRPQLQVPARKLRVLLVDDNHVNQRVAARILQRMGHEADLAGDGVEAVAQAQARHYDLVLMDMQMPRMDGLEATRAIRALPGEASRVRIVAMTANAFSSDRDACFAAGMDDFVGKPVNQDKLFTMLELWSERGARALPGESALVPAVRPDLVDREQLKVLRDELGDEMLEELLGSFRTSATELIRQIEAALAGGDHGAADESLHRLKGSALTLSFAGVADACDNLRSVICDDKAVGAGVALAALLSSLQGCDELLQPEDEWARAAAA